MRIYFAVILIFIFPSCAKKTDQGGTGTQQFSNCSGTDLNSNRRTKTLATCEASLKLCNNRIDFKGQECSGGEIIPSSKTVNESPRDWYSRFRVEKMIGSLLPNGTAFFDKIIIVRRHGTSITPVKSYDRSNWDHLPVTPVYDSDIDFIIQSNNETSEINNDSDTDVDETERNSDATINRCETSYEAIASCFNVEGILDVTNDIWSLYFYNRNIGRTIEVVRDSKVFGDDYSQWVRNHLNFDGIILDQKPGLVLALTAKKSLAHGSQALTIADSLKLVTNSAIPKKYSGLLELVAQDEKYSIFRIPVKKHDPRHFVQGMKLDFFSRFDAVGH